MVGFKFTKLNILTVKFFVVKGVINKKTIEELEMGHYHSFFLSFRNSTEFMFKCRTEITALLMLRKRDNLLIIK